VFLENVKILVHVYLIELNLLYATHHIHEASKGNILSLHNVGVIADPWSITLLIAFTRRYQTR